MDGLSQCSICLVEEDFKDADTVRLSCGHTFHFRCLNEWTKSNNSCPLCRKIVRDQNANITNHQLNDSNIFIQLIRAMNKFCALILLSIYLTMLWKTINLWLIEPTCTGCAYFLRSKGFEMLIWNIIVLVLHGIYSFINFSVISEIT